MKHHFLSLCLAVAASSSSAAVCAPPLISSASLRQVLDTNGGMQMPSEMCNFLNKNKLAVEVLGDSGVMSGVSFGWATATIVDIESQVRLGSRRYNTRTNDQPSTPLARQLMADAVNRVIQTLDTNEAGEDLAALRKNATRKK